MAITLTDKDEWNSVSVPTPGDQAEADLWADIYNDAMDDASSRAYYALRRLEQLTGGTVTGVTATGLAGLAGVDDSLTPSNGTILAYDGSQWTAIAPSTGTTVRAAGSQFLDELLTTNQQGFESGTTGWQSGSNCTIAQSATTARTGSNSLRLQSSAAGNMSANTLTGASGIACVAGEVYTASAYVRAQSAGRAASIGFIWYDNGGSQLSTSFGSTQTNNNSDWTTQVTHQATAPASAEYFAIVVQFDSTTASGEQHYVDDASVRQVLVSRSALSLFGSVLDNATNDAIEYYAGGGRVISVTSNYTVSANDDGATLEVDTTSGAITITLPNGLRNGLEIKPIKVAGSNDVTVAAEGTLTGASGTITGLNTGLRCYVTSTNTWRALPFSGGGIGALRQAATAPTDGTWLLCDGGVYLQSTYPALFEAIGLIYDSTGSDLATIGGALSGGDSGADPKEDAFNDSPTAWSSSQSGSAIVDTAWIGNDLGAAYDIVKVRIQNSSASAQPTTLDIQLADDATFTTDVVTYSFSPQNQGVSAWNEYDIPTTNKRYVRAIARAQTIVAGRWSMSEMEILAGAYTYNNVTEFKLPFIVGASMYIRAAT